MKKIVFCGGGTAGHVMPNIALIEELKKLRNLEIHYIGGRGIEKDILSKYPFVKYHEIDAPKLIRKITLSNLTIPFKLITCINKCKKLLQEIKPNIIFSKGGYVSVPVVMASKQIPVLGHESDYTMGLANKIILHYCDKMFCSFLDTANKNKKCFYSGSPIRKKIFSGNAKILKNKLNIKNNKKNLLVIGGSTGASAINEFICNNLKVLTKNYNIIHITGKNKGNNISADGYYSVEYVHDIENYLALSDIIVSRAGSNAIFEFLALGKPTLLIPLPKEQSRGDQILNAEYFKKNNYASVIQQDELNIDNFLNTLTTLPHPNKSDKQSINGINTILKEIKKYL